MESYGLFRRMPKTEARITMITEAGSGTTSGASPVHCGAKVLTDSQGTKSAVMPSIRPSRSLSANLSLSRMAFSGPRSAGVSWCRSGR